MAWNRALLVFLVRSRDGAFQLRSGEDALVLEASSYSQLRRQLAILVANQRANRSKAVMALVGSEIHRERSGALELSRPGCPVRFATPGRSPRKRGQVNIGCISDLAGRCRTRPVGTDSSRHASGTAILEIDRKSVATAEEAAALIRSGGDKPRLLRVTGATGARFVTVTPG